jgi:hypothetical protein
MTTNNNNKAGQLTLHRDKFNLAAISQSFGALDEVSQRIISVLVENRCLFESSIRDQANMITELHAENTSTIIQEHEKTRTILLDAVCKVDSGRRNAVAGQDDQWNGQEEDLVIRRRAEERIIASLRIPAVSEHCTRIAKAHATTFQWTFRDPTSEDRSLSEIARWLKSGDGIYWVNGKAGSGKSTFMRYIYEHHETKGLLRDWCGDLPLTIASFFFYSGGTRDQKSQVGLLRSLLHQLLREHRSLIPIVLPFQWYDEYIVPVNPQQELFWDRDILRRAFDILRAQNQIRMCLLIDGLDEYEGEKDGSYDEIISFLIGLAHCANTKICLSSRPWLVFEDAFQHAPSLRLQDITSDDIFRYVDEKLNGHERMNDLRRIDPENANKLIKEIVIKASGVFLWVSLIVRSLLDGFTNRDRICDLQKRLQALPSDLESFYKHILLNHIQPIYDEQSSQLFQIVQAANREIYGFRARPLPLLILAFAEEGDDELVLSNTDSLLSEESIVCRCEEMTARLKSRCGGLIEVHRDPSNPLVLNVGFSHHSVHDFLNSQDTRELLISRTKEVFSPDECLFKAYLLHLKLSMVSHPPRASPEHMFLHVEVSGLIQTTLKFARTAMDATGDSYVRFLDELDRVVTSYWLQAPRETSTPPGDTIDLRTLNAHWANFLVFQDPTDVGTRFRRDNFLSLTVSFGLTEYVRCKLKGDSGLLLKKSGQPLLEYIAFSNCPVEAAMVSLLLRSGADPNRNFCGCSIWQYTLEMISVLVKPFSIFKNGTDWMGTDTTSRVLTHPTPEVWSRIFKLFIEGGADSNALCTHIEHIPDRKGLPLYTVRFSTPSLIFSSNGLFPDDGLLAAIKFRGGIEFLECFQLECAFGHVLAEAERIKVEVAVRLQTILRLQKSKRKSTWRYKPRKWQRKARSQEYPQQLLTA